MDKILGWVVALALLAGLGVLLGEVARRPGAAMTSATDAIAIATTYYDAAAAGIGSMRAEYAG